MAEGLNNRAHLRVVASTDQKPNVLAVGDVDAWREGGNALPTGNRMAFVEFVEISRELIETMEPELVASPLLAKGFDCIDLAQALYMSGFRGQFRAMARVLPDPAIVRNEIRTMCPGLDFDILEMPTEQKLRAI
ncbi:MAG: hypothetical protein GKR99_12405 [Rhodobacteraceae bacterium]|nr:hypothetical protein [Paracoccaceae bacterium]